MTKSNIPIKMENAVKFHTNLNHKGEAWTIIQRKKPFTIETDIKAHAKKCREGHGLTIKEAKPFTKLRC